MYLNVCLYTSMYSCELKGPGSKQAPLGISAPRSQFLMQFPNKNESRFLVEMAGSEAGAEEIPDEPGKACYARNWRGAQN